MGRFAVLLAGRFPAGTQIGADSLPGPALNSCGSHGLDYFGFAARPGDNRVVNCAQCGGALAGVVILLYLASFPTALPNVRKGIRIKAS